MKWGTWLLCYFEWLSASSVCLLNLKCIVSPILDEVIIFKQCYMMVLFVLDLYVTSLRKQFSVSEETYSLGTMNMGTENPAEIALR